MFPLLVVRPILAHARFLRGIIVPYGGEAPADEVKCLVAGSPRRFRIESDGGIVHTFQFTPRATAANLFPVAPQFMDEAAEPFCPETIFHSRFLHAVELSHHLFQPVNLFFFTLYHIRGKTPIWHTLVELKVQLIYFPFVLELCSIRQGIAFYAAYKRPRQPHGIRKVCTENVGNTLSKPALKGRFPMCSE